jgi:hypothetical protein
MVADLKGRLHGTGGDFEGLDYEGPNQQGQEYGNGNGFGIFPDSGFFFVRGGPRDFLFFQDCSFPEQLYINFYI